MDNFYSQTGILSKRKKVSANKLINTDLYVCQDVLLKPKTGGR